ncbi:hypothetical protein [Nonomuraea bangladeshensis]|uniref:hypothetical protein n=1 Tax=Nonomuraea bangladeshensis TaxID=404385 RepID=UPI003C2D4A09
MLRQLLAVLRPQAAQVEDAPAASRVAALREELAGAEEVIARLADDLAEACRSRGEARRELDAARAEIGRLLIQLESVDRAVEPYPEPRTPSQELAAMKAHVTALEDRLHRLQATTMARDRA